MEEVMTEVMVEMEETVEDEGLLKTNCFVDQIIISVCLLIKKF